MSLSMRPSEAVTGGFLDDLDVEVTGSEFVDDFDYGGRRDTPLLALKITFESDDLNEPVEQYYSLGDKALKKVRIGKSGALEEKTKGAKLNKGSNFMFFLENLVSAGFPEDLLDDCDPAVFQGLQGHIMDLPRPKIRGQEGEKTVTVFTEIAEPFPWEEKKGSKKGSKKAESGDDDVKAKAQEVILAILANGESEVDSKSLKASVFKYCSSEDKISSDLRGQITALVGNKKFLADGPWGYDPKAGTVTSLD